MDAMTEHTDVAIVGARCAGSPLAALLAHRGVRVTVLERATFPQDTLSSHLFEADALAFLDRLGVTEQLRATGAPYVARTDTRIEDVHLDMELPLKPGDVGGIASVRRWLLDPILADAAAQAGAQVRMGAQVTGLLREHGRVTGVRVREDGRESDLRARLVVGADGRHSTVARLAGARRYNTTPNQRLLFWRFFENADPEMTFLSHRWEDKFILGIPSDSGLYQVLLWPEMAELERFRADRDAAFMEHARQCEPVAAALASATPAGKTIGVYRWEGFFREASGLGWVLTGDAGHFKSPAPGRGIGDAFLQAQSLAPAIADALEGPEETLDAATARWGRERKREFAEHYWLAYDLEEAGTVPAVLVEMMRRLQQQGQAGRFFDVLNHRARPSQVLTPPRVAGASARLLARRGTARRALLAEVGSLGVREARRRWLNARPVYAPADDAGEHTAEAAAEDEVSAAGT
jgi:2-polyprenyl-6-methoxyphenol hydroxylase-like FAD-dependent oxidoreductase